MRTSVNMFFHFNISPFHLLYYKDLLRLWFIVYNLIHLLIGLIYKAKI